MLRSSSLSGTFCDAFCFASFTLFVNISFNFNYILYSGFTFLHISPYLIWHNMYNIYFNIKLYLVSHHHRLPCSTAPRCEERIAAVLFLPQTLLMLKFQVQGFKFKASSFKVQVKDYLSPRSIRRPGPVTRSSNGMSGHAQRSASSILLQHCVGLFPLG